MSFGGTIRNRKTGESLKAFFSILLLLLYVVGNIQFETLHQLFHSRENIVTHSSEQEKDPCHTTIYHHETKNDCGHKSHIIVKSTCAFCDVIGHSDQTFISFNSDTSFKFPNVFCADQLSFEVSDTQLKLRSRAPPVL